MPCMVEPADVEGTTLTIRSQKRTKYCRMNDPRHWMEDMTQPIGTESEGQKSESESETARATGKRARARASDRERARGRERGGGD